MYERRLSALQRACMAAIWTSVREPVPALGGGTALAAFYADHRRSDDLDLFVGHPGEVARLGDALAGLLSADVPAARLTIVGAHPLQRRYEVSLADAETVIDIAVLEAAPRSTEVMDGVRVLSITDIAGGKMAAAARRVELKDAVDLWALRETLGLLRRT